MDLNLWSFLEAKKERTWGQERAPYSKHLQKNFSLQMVFHLSNTQKPGWLERDIWVQIAVRTPWKAKIWRAVSEEVLRFITVETAQTEQAQNTEGKQSAEDIHSHGHWIPILKVSGWLFPSHSKEILQRSGCREKHLPGKKSSDDGPSLQQRNDKKFVAHSLRNSYCRQVK